MSRLILARGKREQLLERLKNDGWKSKGSVKAAKLYLMEVLTTNGGGALQYGVTGQSLGIPCPSRPLPQLFNVDSKISNRAPPL